jgi:hypothetical protein
LRNDKDRSKRRISDMQIHPASEWTQGSERRPHRRGTPVEIQEGKWGSRECPWLGRYQDFIPFVKQPDKHRSIIREIEAVKLDLRRGEPGLADHWVRGTRYPVEMERTLKLAWNDPERDGHMIHARYFLEQARRAVLEYKRHHGRIPACAADTDEWPLRTAYGC